MRDDVGGTFRYSPRVVSTRPHPVSFGTVHKFLCERDQPIRCSDVFVVKGDTTEDCFSSQSSKKSSVPASTANRCRCSEEAKSTCAGEPSIARDHLRVVGTFHKSLQGHPSNHVSAKFPQELRIRDTINMSLGTFHKWLESRETDRAAQKFSGTFCQKISDCHALYALALHGVVSRPAVCLHSLFSEECLYCDLHVFRRSSGKVCSSRSMAVGGARPYLRSASV